MPAALYGDILASIYDQNVQVRAAAVGMMSDNLLNSFDALNDRYTYL